MRAHRKLFPRIYSIFFVLYQAYCYKKGTYNEVDEYFSNVVLLDGQYNQ